MVSADPAPWHVALHYFFKEITVLIDRGCKDRTFGQIGHHGVQTHPPHIRLFDVNLVQIAVLEEIQGLVERIADVWTEWHFDHIHEIRVSILRSAAKTQTIVRLHAAAESFGAEDDAQRLLVPFTHGS